MYDLNKLNKVGTIICPNSTKEQILKIINNDFDYNYKFITKEELFNNVYFNYDEKAILFLMKKGYSYDTSVEILKNLTFISKGNDKLDTLYSLKNELLENNLLSSNQNFIYLLKKPIYIINYSKFDNELKLTLDNLKLEYEYIDDEVKISSFKDVISFEKVDKEVKYIFNEICRLNINNIPLTNIHLYSVPEVYLNTVKKYAALYNMPINFPSEITLYHTPLFKTYLNLVKEKGLTGGLEIIDSRIDSYNIKDSIITILNNIINLDEDENLKLELLINAAKKKVIKTPIFKNGIDIVSSDYRGSDNDYIFMMGFSLGNYPLIHKDTALLSDEEKTLCSMNTSSILNKIEEEKIINFINENKNLYITKIKKEGKDLGTTFFNSLLIEKLKMNEIAYDENNEDNILYVESLGKLQVAKAYDAKRNYNVDSKYLDAYSKDDISYLEFDHKFKPSDKFKYDKNMRVSYSRINEYYKCPFAYFIKYICLKGQGFEDTFDTKLGTLFHKILEESLTQDISLDDYEKEVEENFKEPDENHFIKKLLPQVLDVINKNKKFLETSKFNRPIGEQEINVTLDSNTILNGRIDKIVFNDRDKEAIIVDYKSSNSLYFNKDYVQYGLNMQLPTYALLSNEVWPDYKVHGLYIQHILTEDYSFEKSYALNGVSLKDVSFIERIEPNIGNNENNSIYLQSISLNSDQTKINRADIKKNLLCENELEELYKTTKEKYLDAIKNIRDGKFNINPIYINEDDSNSCKYCPLKTICFKDNDDINYVDNKNLKEGEENGD